MTPEQVIAEVERYEVELTRIHASFKRTRDGIHIADGDEALYRRYARELVDLYNDALGNNSYSAQVVHEFQNGFGYLGTPSLKGVENVLGVVRLVDASSQESRTARAKADSGGNSQKGERLLDSRAR